MSNKNISRKLMKKVDELLHDINNFRAAGAELFFLLYWLITKEVICEADDMISSSTPSFPRQFSKFYEPPKDLFSPRYEGSETRLLLLNRSAGTCRVVLNLKNNIDLICFKLYNTTLSTQIWADEMITSKHVLL